MIRIYIVEANEITEYDHQMIHRYIRNRVSPKNELFKLHSGVLK